LMVSELGVEKKWDQQARKWRACKRVHAIEHVKVTLGQAQGLEPDLGPGSSPTCKCVWHGKG
jgi:hypothetical protein